MKKKIYMHGSFMNDNYGDFLLYYVAANKASKVRDDIEIISADVSETYDDYINVSRENKYKAIFNCNAAFLAGGGYFSEPPTRKLYWNIRYFIKHALPLFILGFRKTPYAILGAGVGPMSYSFSKMITRKIFNNADTVSVRDKESKSFLEGIGVVNKIQIVPDWVMGMEMEDLIKDNSRVDDIINKFEGSEKIYVHLTTKNSEKNPGMEIVIRDLVKYSQDNKNAQFIVGCDQAREIQEERAKDIVSRLPSNRVLFFPYLGPWVLSSMLNKVDTIVTDKLHVGVVGTRLGKYVISVPYHTKTLRFYNQLGLCDRSKMLKDISEDEIFNMLTTDKDNRNVYLKSIIEESKINYDLLENFIKKIM
jgi:polysaccharide pyruvyl transferase WcaK-like protein